MPSGGVKLGEGLKEVYERTGLVKVTFVYKPFESLLNDLMEAKPQKHLYWVGAATMDSGQHVNTTFSQQEPFELF